MTQAEILQEMSNAFREDRERFFKVADSLIYQPKYKDKLEELEELKQQWRDVPDLPDYPNITHPLPLPEWFPAVKFASCWKKDIYLLERITYEEEIDKLKKAIEEDNE